MFDFDPTSLFDPEKFKEVSIPSYEEWLSTSAKVIEAHPILNIIKGVFKGIRYLSSREEAFISILEQRGVWGGEDTELLNQRTQDFAKSFNKDMVKAVMRGVTSGDLKLQTPAGQSLVITPDAAMAALNEFVLNEEGLTGKSVEILANLLGEDEAALRGRYDQEVQSLEALNKTNSLLREAMASASSLFSKTEDAEPVVDAPTEDGEA